MTKIKSIITLLIGALLALFIYENWVAAPHIKLFGKELVQLTISLIIIIVFSLGLIVGWLGCLGWRRARRRSAPVSGEEKAPEPQSGAQQEAKQE
jgi:Na+/H+-dicarboxylate symporter